MAAIERAGQRIAYETGGSGERAVVFMHNLFCNRSVFESQARRIGEGFRTVCIDFRGHGDSRGVQGSFDIADLAADVTAVMDHLRIGRATLVGLSLGGSTAMQMVTTQPARVEGLVLMGSTPWAAGVRDRVANTVLAALVRRVGVTRAGSSAMLDVLFGRSFRSQSSETLDEWRNHLRSLAGPDASYALRAWTDRAAMTDRLGSVRVPALVVVGDEDVACPLPHGEAIRAAIPGATLARIPNTGHTMAVEQPAYTAKLIETFLRESAGRSAS